MIYSLRIAIVPIPGQQFILAFGAVAVAYKLAHTDHFQTKSGKKPQTVSLDLISQLSTNAQLHTEATKRIHKHSVRNSICVFPVCGTCTISFFATKHHQTIGQCALLRACLVFVCVLLCVFGSMHWT